MTQDQAQYDTQDELQQIADPADLRKWRIELPNLYDDSDLDPYEFRLLVHYKRVGVCTQSTVTTANMTKMSRSQVSEKRQALHDKGFIVMETVYLDEEHKTYSYKITVVDMWEENFKKYSTRPLKRHPRPLSGRGVHSVEQRKNTVKKEPIKKEKKAAEPQPPEILVFREVASHYPKQQQRELVIDAIQKIQTRLGRDVVASDLQPFFLEWAKVSANDWSLVWLVDWAVPGFVPQRGQKQNPINAGISVAQRWLAEREKSHAL